MKIKLITLRSGPDGTHQPGAELDTDAGEISKKDARELVDGGYAVELKTRKGETAQMKSPDNAMLMPTAEEDARENLARIAEAQAAADAQAVIDVEAKEEHEAQIKAEAEQAQKLVGEEAYRAALDGGATEEDAEAARAQAIADFLA